MLLNLLISFTATLFVGIMFDVSFRVAFYSAIAGCLSYGVFLLIPDNRVSYFTATFLLSFMSFVFAKIAKSPSTVFIIIGIYTLVPGSGIYETMLNLVNANYNKASQLGATTLINMALMAMAIAISNSLARLVFTFFENKLFKKNKTT